MSPDAKLFFDRREILSLLPKGCVFVEVGVGLGDFSRIVLSTLCPSRLEAIDLFDLHKLQDLWGQRTSRIFGLLTHEQFYRNRFRNELEAGVVRILNGDSTRLLSGLTDASVDAVYLDATHLYENVAAELRQSARIVKEGGLIILNDYIMFDHLTMAEYGVIQATNEFVVEGGWEVICFALQQQMFCDIALRRK